MTRKQKSHNEQCRTPSPTEEMWSRTLMIMFEEFWALGQWWTLDSRRSKTQHQSSRSIWSIWAQYLCLNFFAGGYLRSRRTPANDSLHPLLRRLCSKILEPTHCFHPLRICVCDGCVCTSCRPLDKGSFHFLHSLPFPLASRPLLLVVGLILPLVFELLVAFWCHASQKQAFP